MTVESYLAAIEARKLRVPGPLTNHERTKIVKNSWRRHLERMREAGITIPKGDTRQEVLSR